MLALIILCGLIAALFILPLLLLIFGFKNVTTDQGRFKIFIALVMLAAEAASILIGPFEKLVVSFMHLLGLSVYVYDNHTIFVVLILALEYISYKIYKLIVKKAVVKSEDNASEATQWK